MDLESYYLQLQQVDAALTSDPTNEELIKLKQDLQEVIDLTNDLLQESGSSVKETVSVSHSVPTGSSSSSSIPWNVGDKCSAPWSQDGQYYEAIIEEIQADGKVSVGFPQYSHGDVTDMNLLRRIDGTNDGESSQASSSSGAVKRPGPKESLAERKQALLKQKEYLKRRKQKKQARVQEQEQEREKDKKKWLHFSHKKGLMNKKKSIFASPETVDGRVGVGTCGVSGKPMTEFSAAEKWRKGWK